jgi:5-methylcytosine-specific restriction endonuclease McrA
MSALKNLTAQKFGILTVVSRAHNDKQGRSMWCVVCECGNKKIISGTNLLTGHHKSCGCLRGHRIYNGDTKIERDREWYRVNKDKINKKRSERYLLIKDNLKYKLNKNISSYISLSLRGNKNGYHWELIVGYTLDDLISHLEEQFTDGMTWKNRGKKGWHIDHIIPLSAFNFKTPQNIDFKKAWALKNLRPLWSIDNLRKGKKLQKPFQPSLPIDDVIEKLELEKRMLIK